MQLVNHFDHIIVAGGAPDTKLQNRESVFTPLQCTLTLLALFYPLKRGSTICALPPPPLSALPDARRMCWWFGQQMWALTARFFAHQHRLQVRVHPGAKRAPSRV